MKYKTGFTTNSSSSSFLLALNKDINEIDFNKIFNVNQESPLYNTVQELIKLLKSDLDEYTLKELLDADYFYEQNEKEIKKYDKYFLGSACDDDTAIENLLCDIDLNYKDNDIMIIKEGGY